MEVEEIMISGEVMMDAIRFIYLEEMEEMDLE
jgi:hypothetical protein